MSAEGNPHIKKCFSNRTEWRKVKGSLHGGRIKNVFLLLVILELNPLPQTLYHYRRRLCVYSVCLLSFILFFSPWLYLSFPTFYHSVWHISFHKDGAGGFDSYSVLAAGNYGTSIKLNFQPVCLRHHSNMISFFKQDPMVL